MPLSLARLANIARTLLTLLLLTLSGLASAASHSYALYLDTDLNPATGCTASAVDASGSYTRGGFEYRIEVSV
ncbi:MAG: hypothetical protein HYS20_13005, partial [Rhodocyclales bacterium]|nr:hypothetical protein [Rhodocyclales bacterium]